MLEKCTNRSLPPSSGVMNPYPFSLLNHLTVPSAIDASAPRVSGIAPFCWRGNLANRPARCRRGTANRVAAMRLVTYRAESEPRAGVLTDAGVLDAAGLLGTDAIGIREL